MQPEGKLAGALGISFALSAWGCVCRWRQAWVGRGVSVPVVTTLAFGDSCTEKGRIMSQQDRKQANYAFCLS